MKTVVGFETSPTTAISISKLKRILIIGSGGAGKSTLAIQLGKLLNLEVIHLDAHFWNAGWVETPQPEWDAVVADLTAKNSWIIDGNFARTLPVRMERADTVIFLDSSRYLCFYRILKRIAQSYGRTRPDMAEGCNEKFDWEFIVWLWRFPRDIRPKIIDILNQFPDVKKIILRSPQDVVKFLSTLSR